MKTKILVGFAVLCILGIVLADGEKGDCMDTEKMKGMLKDMKEKGKNTYKECKETTSGLKEFFNCMKNKAKESFESWSKEKSLDDIIAEYMEYVLPDKKEEVEKAGRECAAEHENSNHKQWKFKECWFKKVSEFCNTPFGYKRRKGSSGEGIPEE